MGIQATQADSSLLSYARMNLPRGNCAETRDIPTVREPETVCQINVDNYIRSIFESLVDNFGEERALDMAFSGLRLSPPEKYGEYLCKFILQINCEPICEDVDDALLDADSQIQSFSREELISKLTTAVFFSTQYRQLTRSLHQLERAPGEFLVFDLPMRVQKILIQKLSIYNENQMRDIRSIFAASIYQRTIFAPLTWQRVSPLEYAFAQKNGALAQQFIELGATVEGLDIRDWPTDKLFRLLPAMKTFSDEIRKMSITILNRAVIEKNVALADAVFALGHLSPPNPCVRSEFISFLNDAVDNEDDSMIGVFYRNGLTFEEGKTPLEKAAEAGHFERVAQLLQSNLHGQRNVELIEKAMGKAFSLMRFLGLDNLFRTNEKVDYNETLEQLNQHREELQYFCTDTTTYKQQ